MPPAIIIPWIGIGGGFLLLLLGLLWAPFAGSICARAARRNGRDPARYMQEGMKASALQFLPWFYLLSLIREKPLSERVIRAGYILIYALWLLGPVMTWLVLGGQTLLTATEDIDAGSDAVKVLWVAVDVVIAGMNGFVWYHSLRKLRLFHHMRQNAIDPSPLLLIPDGYLSVFKYSVMSYLAMPLFLVITVAIAFTTGAWE